MYPSAGQMTGWLEGGAQVRKTWGILVMLVLSAVLLTTTGVWSFSHVFLGASADLRIVPGQDALIGVVPLRLSTIEVERGGSASLSLQVQNRSAAAVYVSATCPQLISGVTLVPDPPAPGVATPADGFATCTITASASSAASEGTTFVPLTILAQREGFSAQIDTSVSIKVCNAPPEVADDAIETTAGVSVRFNPLINDRDPEGHELQVIEVTQGAHGVVTIGADGWVAYAPDPAWQGTDTFTYLVSDGEGGEGSATVEASVR